MQRSIPPSLKLLLPLLQNDDVKLIVINGLERVYVAATHSWEDLAQVNVKFPDHQTLQTAAQYLIGYRDLEQMPYGEKTYGNGIHVVTMVPPIVASGLVIIIRKPRPLFTIDQLMNRRVISPEAIEFLKACVIAGIKIMICGERGAGKNTLLKALSSFLPDDMRIAVIGYPPLPTLRQDHVIYLTPQSPSRRNTNILTMRQLFEHVVPGLRLDYLVVDNLGGTAVPAFLEWLSTQNMATFLVEAIDTNSALAYLEACCLLDAPQQSRQQVKRLIASAVELIVCVQRGASGRYLVTKITDVRGVESERYALQDLYHLLSISEKDHSEEHLRPTGWYPSFMPKVKGTGIDLPPVIFGADRPYRQVYE